MSKRTVVIVRVASCLALLAGAALGARPAHAGCIPVAEIVNNGIDEDCDGVDSCYRDLDNDHYGTPVVIDSNDLDCTDANESGVSNDCNDGNPAVHPGAPEIVGNSNDEDCNGQELCYRDNDNDDYGTPTTVVSVDVDCTDNFEATNSTDCNDGNAAVHPGATEIVGNSNDEDCNGQELCYQDNDNDDYGTSTTVTSVDVDCTDNFEATNATDCNDGNAAVHPGATEIVANSNDEDCNGQELCYQDNDNDDFGTSTTVTSTDVDCFDAFEATNTTDCNDGSAAIHPGAMEIVADNIDEDCNNQELCYRDNDNDDFGTIATVISTDIDCLDAFEAMNTTDCNDSNANIHPGAMEIVADNIDEDCNGQEVCYRDTDNDDYGTIATVTSTDIDCLDAFEAMNTTDCNDSNANIHPGATEIVADNIDEDCNGQEVCYRDNDNDDYGTSSTVNSTDIDCLDNFEATNTTDCNDANANIHPGAAEICNTLDDDCDTQVDEGFPAPGGVPTFALTDSLGNTQLSWPAIPGATVYDVVKGRLQSLASSYGDFTVSTAACLANDVVGTTTMDGAVPGVGDGFWYLVRGVNCSTPGTYESGALSQTGLRDPEIAASPARCP